MLQHEMRHFANNKKTVTKEQILYDYLCESPRVGKFMETDNGVARPGSSTSES